MAKHAHHDGHHFKKEHGHMVSHGGHHGPHDHMPHRARGGAATDPHKDKEVKPYNAAGSHVEKEAEEKKHGGKVCRKRGGRAEGHVDGHKPKHRIDRPKRAAGGKVGADKSPFTHAYRTTQAEGHKTVED